LCDSLRHRPVILIADDKLMMATPNTVCRNEALRGTRVAVGMVALHFDDQVYQTVS